MIPDLILGITLFAELPGRGATGGNARDGNRAAAGPPRRSLTPPSRGYVLPGPSPTRRREASYGGAREQAVSAGRLRGRSAKATPKDAMRNIDDSIECTARGDNALTGAYNGKQLVGELLGNFMSTDFRTEPHDFVAESDKVIVLTTVHLEGEVIESADVLTYKGDGKLVAFDTPTRPCPTGCSQRRANIAVGTHPPVSPPIGAGPNPS
jgi:hypothetical protein